MIGSIRTQRLPMLVAASSGTAACAPSVAASAGIANHFAIDAARGFLAPEDHRWLQVLFADPEVRSSLLIAQARYAAGGGEQDQAFHPWGARFWREIEKVLTNPPNRAGRIAALSGKRTSSPARSLATPTMSRPCSTGTAAAAPG